MSETTAVAIVGAGPYGLSLAAHLGGAGVGTRVFGGPMQTWREGMPEGMFLKSEGFASSLSDPAGAFTLGHYCRERGLPYADVGWPVPLHVFAAYGEAFARRFVPQREDRRVTRVSRAGRGFRVALEGGEVFTAERVAVATGIEAFARIPDELAGLPASAVSHSSRHSSYAGFRGRSVAVIGAGASALDAAAALRRAGAEATLVSRRAEVRFFEAGPPRRPVDAILAPLTPLGPGWKKWLCCEAPLLFHALPEPLRVGIVRRYLGPAPARFVREAIEGHVPYVLRSRVAGAAATADGRVELRVVRQDGEAKTLTVDHVLAATGYRVELSRLPFLDAALLPDIATVDGSPRLNRDFESTVPGLHFLGTPAAYSFGPMFRFACGADYAARRVTRRALAGMPEARRRRGGGAPAAAFPAAAPRA